ncbi:MAG: hypothetical protein HFI99_17115 [Lachnospiraceae bacterium]|jgi:hypothetical protein|nr:hypothetical protein [Lachnospiraceae bacterium]
MRTEKGGFVLHLDGTWMEISNKYGVVEHGDVAANPGDVPEGYAEKALDKFIQQHRILEKSTLTCVKKVAFDKLSKEYIQLQAIFSADRDCWIVQKFDNELVYMGEIWSGYKYQDEVVAWMRTNYNIESCFVANVYRNNSLGDCTNDGISSHAGQLYILSEQKGQFEPEDIRQCVYIEWRDVCGEQYIDCKPIYFKKRWYMAGGNFLYTSDRRFREITKSKYPIPIHDRYEGR